MFTESDYEKLHQIMAESPEKKELLTRLLESHRMDISTISHEIRNPLTLVYSTLQMIEASNPEVLDIRHWSDLHSDIEYMKQLLEELSAYNNSQRLSLASTDFDIFLKKIALSFASSIIETDIEFVSRIDPGLLVMPADSIKLTEVLLNLLGNARDAVLASSDVAYVNDSIDTDTNHNTSPIVVCTDNSKCTPDIPRIKLNAYATDSELIISISDNGCGITPEHLDSIFQPFVTYKATGTGLGLPLARKIIQAHGGTLTVRSGMRLSGDGMRTIFTITLPICENCQQKS